MTKNTFSISLEKIIEIVKKAKDQGHPYPPVDVQVRAGRVIEYLEKLGIYYYAWPKAYHPGIGIMLKAGNDCIISMHIDHLRTVDLNIRVQNEWPPSWKELNLNVLHKLLSEGVSQ